MKELSIFVDESGDFGDYAEHSSYGSIQKYVGKVVSTDNNT